MLGIQHKNHASRAMHISLKRKTRNRRLTIAARGNEANSQKLAHPRHRTWGKVKSLSRMVRATLAVVLPTESIPNTLLCMVGATARVVSSPVRPPRSHLLLSSTVAPSTGQPSHCVLKTPYGCLYYTLRGTLFAFQPARRLPIYYLVRWRPGRAPATPERKD